MAIPSTYEIKQAEELRNSIIRLCNEADSRTIAINGTLNALFDMCIERGLSPIEVVRLIIDSVCLLSKSFTPKDLLSALKEYY